MVVVWSGNMPLQQAHLHLVLLRLILRGTLLRVSKGCQGTREKKGRSGLFFPLSIIAMLDMSIIYF